MPSAASFWCSSGLAFFLLLAAPLIADPVEISDQLIYERIVYTPFLAQPQPPDTAALSDTQKLGKDIFFDSTLSSPAGYACASCHAPQTGYTGPSSAVNILAGPVSGVIAGRVGKRKPPTISYAAFSPVGPAYYPNLQEYIGGTFWDGRTPDTARQARMPFVDPNELANTPTGPSPPHPGGFSTAVARKLANRPYAPLLRKTLGEDVFVANSDEQLYEIAATLISDYEASAEIVPFSSKYDASKYGNSNKVGYVLTPSEERGRALFFGRAQCFQCHSSANLPAVLKATMGRETFTMYCFANTGVPRNPSNPYFYETNSSANPLGYNPLGASYVDYGLGSNPNLGTDGTVFMNLSPGDVSAFRGMFKAPTLRNADKRPNLAFVKAYMHNGFFKSLKEVVHFYNKRNVAADLAGNEMAFDLRVGPPAGFTRLINPPAVIENVQNVAGVSPANAGADLDHNGQLGNLGLSNQDEDDLVSFISALSDGFTNPGE